MRFPYTRERPVHLMLTTAFSPAEPHCWSWQAARSARSTRRRAHQLLKPAAFSTTFRAHKVRRRLVSSRCLLQRHRPPTAANRTLPLPTPRRLGLGVSCNKIMSATRSVPVRDGQSISPGAWTPSEPLMLATAPCASTARSTRACIAGGSVSTSAAARLRQPPASGPWATIPRSTGLRGRLASI